MKDPRNWSWVVVLAAIALGLALTTISCSGDDDDDDEDDAVSYGSDIEGVYSVRITTVADSCDEEAVGEYDDWILEIEQGEDLGTATVYRQQTGAGAEQEEFFKGKVYGNTVVLLETEETKIGDSSCMQVKLRNYRLTVGDPSTADVTGQLYDDTFYLGGCDSSVQDCEIEATVEPLTTTNDDDTEE